MSFEMSIPSAPPKGDNVPVEVIEPLLVTPPAMGLETVKIPNAPGPEVMIFAALLMPPDTTL